MAVSKRVLIVDDEEEAIHVLADILGDIGYTVESARSGPEALEKLSPAIDLVLLDVKMPEMNGFEVARKIREHPSCKDVPIIIVTALGDQKDRLDAVKAGANDFISKPVDMTELEIRAKALLERKNTQDELRLARDAAEEANRAKAAFLAAMSHEIRTPMNGVIGMVDLLSRTNLEENQKEMTETIRTSSFSLVRIIDDILDFSKIEAGKFELEKTPVSICDALEGVAEILSPLADKKGVLFRLYVDPEIPSQVWSDLIRLRQIMLNICGNAVKFTETGRVFMRADLISLNGNKEARVCFRVFDTGIGIPEEVRPHLFEAFTQAEDSTTRRFGGTGLGLAISKGLVESMGGSIEIDSLVGEGSTFTVNLSFPVVEDSVNVQADDDLERLRVLIINNDEEESFIVRRYLEYWKADVDNRLVPDIAHTTAIALEAAANGNPYDIIVLAPYWPPEAQTAVCHSIRNEAALSDIRYVLLAKDKLKAEKIVPPDSVLVGTNPMRRASFLRAVAVAVGRKSPEIEYSEHEDDLQLIREAPSVEEALQDGKLILFAEDHPTNQKVVLQQLNRLGYAAETVWDGREAYEAWKTGRYSLILTDIHMPNMDGYDLARAVRKGEAPGKHIPIVALTANVLSGENQRCYEAGMDDFMAKPVEMKTILEKLGRWIPPGKPGESEKKEQVSTGRVDESSPVDLGFLEELFGADRGIIKSMIDEFLIATYDDMKAIGEALKIREPEMLRETAHRIKGATRTIGAKKMTEIAYAMEMAGKNGDWDIVENNISLFTEEIDRLTNFLEEL